MIKPARPRCKTHLKHVAGMACTICFRRPCTAHHLTTAQPKAMGLKSGDQWTVPLCNLHHLGENGVHPYGDEREFFAEYFGRDIYDFATGLALHSPSKKIREAAGK